MRHATRLLQRDIAALDRELATLGRGACALRLQLGEALERLAVQGGHHQCGFSSLAAYAQERCERSGRWAIESRTVARRVVALPRLRAAMASGEVSWSMGELLARHAFAESEGELVARAPGCTVRQMREVLKVGGRETDEESEPAMRTLTITVPVQEAWAFECTRMLINRLEGGRASIDTIMTAMLAEGEITLQGMAVGERDGRVRSEDRAARAAAWRKELARWRAQAEVRCEARIARTWEKAAGAGSAGTRGAGAAEQRDGGAGHEGDAGEQRGAGAGYEDPVTLDRRIRALAAELTQRELSLGSLALRLFAADGWRRLGYASPAQYARERVGISHSALKSHMTLARRARSEAVVREAVCEGRIGREAALLVGRVATPRTAEAWVARAEQRTIKLLHEEVVAAELIGRVMERGDVEPPDEEMMEEVAALERAVLSGRVYRDRFAGAGANDAGCAQGEAMQDGQMSACREAVDDGEAQSQMSACEEYGVPPPPRRGSARTTLRLRVSDETYRYYRALEEDYVRRTACPLGFLGFLCWSVWDSWHAGLGREVAYGGIYARDRYRCSSPVCTRGDVTPHHLRFRSHGGDDTAENLTALCVWCHLEGVHGGRIRAVPPASAIRWTIGERPILVVHGRRKLEVERADGNANAA